MPPKKTVATVTTAPAPAPSVSTAERVKVRVINFMGFAGDPPRRRRIGDVFTISGERWPEGHAKAGALKEFAAKWMELVDPSTPERSMSPADAARAAERSMQAGTATMDIHGNVSPDRDDEDSDAATAPTGHANVLG